MPEVLLVESSGGETLGPKRASHEAYDPICGRRIDSDRGNGFSAEYRKRRYLFCSERCQRTFEQHTERLRLGDLARAGALLTQGKVCWGLA